MFSATTKAFVKSLGAQGDLIYNENVNEKLEMLTLFKVRQTTFWPVIRYSIIDQTLLDLLEEEIFPEYTEEVLTEDFENLRATSGQGSAKAVIDGAEINVTQNIDMVDGSSSFTLKKKTVDINKLRKSCANKKVNKKLVEMLKVRKTEKLAFVHETVYNTKRIDLFVKAGLEGSITAAFKTFFNMNMTGNKKEQIKYTVPEESTIAYAVMEVITDDGTVVIPPRTRKVRQYNTGWWVISRDGEEDDSNETLRKVTKEIKKKEGLLLPLEDLNEPIRRDLLKTLGEVLEDRALCLLEKTLDQDTDMCDHPHQSQAVSSFMDLLGASDATTNQKDAVRMLISAMDALPDDVPALLTSCSPDTLRVLNQLVDNLKEDSQTEPPESLQKEEELHWVVKLLCSTNQMLKELMDQWDRPEVSPEVLLEVLCLVIQGLSLMQPETDS